jgi:hypothetical protein
VNAVVGRGLEHLLVPGGEPVPQRRIAFPCWKDAQNPVASRPANAPQSVACRPTARVPALGGPIAPTASYRVLGAFLMPSPSEAEPWLRSSAEEGSCRDRSPPVSPP